MGKIHLVRWSKVDKGAYNRLLDAAARHGIQQKAEWLDQFVAAYLQDEDTAVLQVYDGEQLVGCLPMQVEERRATRLWNLKRLLGLGTGPTDFFYILALPGREEDVANELFQWFVDNNQEWDELDFSFIPQDCKVGYLLADKLAASTVSLQKDTSRLYYSLDTSGSWDEYYTPEFNKKIRDIRGRLNRVQRNEITLTYEEHTSGISPYLDEFIETFNRRRQDKNEKSSFEDDRKIRLIRGILPAYEKNGWIKLSVLRDSDGAAWAYQLDLFDKGTWYHYAPAFDDEYAWYSPSKLLLYHTLQKCFEQPDIEQLNFMRGESHYKTQFTEYTQAYLRIQAQNNESLRVKGWKAAHKLVTIKNKLF